MKQQNTIFKLQALVMAMSAVLALTACGGGDTRIVEREPIVTDDDDHDDHNHGGEAGGRLFVLNSGELQAEVFDLDDNDLITSIALDAIPSSVYASGAYRYAALIERNANKVSFVDGGLWQEPHDDHFDLYSSTPKLINYSLAGSRPTHFVAHDGEVAIFYDGDAAADSNASVQVITDELIAGAGIPVEIDFDMPMHGVAEPRGEHLLSTIRRDDADSTSNNFILPDQVGVYHLHDGSYELEQTLDIACPDLHGAAQNEGHVVFGCSDGVLLAIEGENGDYSAQKIDNPDSLMEGARIGSIWGHEASEQFIGLASSGDVSQFFVIDPVLGELELVDWEPLENAKPVARGFAYEAEQFVILDNQGYLTQITPHQEGDYTHWEYSGRIEITGADLSAMPEGANFSMTFSQNAHTVYIADPISQHIVVVDLDTFEVSGEIELDYVPSMITWLGIAEEHDH